MDFGQYLKELISKRGYSYRQLAMLADIDHTYISKIANGKTGIPSPEILKKLSRPLGVPYEELLKSAGYLPEKKEVNYDIPKELSYFLGENVTTTYMGKPITESQKKKIIGILEEPISDDDALFVSELVANMQSEYGKKPSDQLVKKLTNIHKRLKKEALEKWRE